MEETTRNLIEKAKSGDPDSLAEVFEIYRDRIRGLVRKKLSDPLRANLESSDIVQSVCLEAMKGIDNLEYKNEDGFVHWLARIAENTIRDKYRYFGAQKRRQPVAGDDDGIVTVSQAPGVGPTPSRVAGQSEQMETVLHALRELPDEYREVIRLVRFEKKSHKEAAEILGKTEKATRMLLARARVRLLKELGTHLDDEGDDES